jgi:glucose/arabinose dehydrogenase
MHIRPCLLLAAASLALAVPPARAQTPWPNREATVTGTRYTPGHVQIAPDEVARSLRVPAGFRVNVFAQGLGLGTRMLAVADDGTVYVTRRDSNDVVMLRDRDGDGRADETRKVVKDIPFVHGIALHGGRMYLVSTREVHMAELRPDGTLEPFRMIIDDLPDGGQHPNRTIGFGPDSMMYISIGSHCNDCNEDNQEAATLVRARADGTGRGVFARGLRNTVGWDFHPRTGELWGSDMGTDWRGDDLAPDEINRIQNAGDYGWPWCYGDRVVDDLVQYEPQGSTKELHCARTAAPVLVYPQAHASPIQMKFYTGAQFPAEYQGDAFATLRGSWNRSEPSGYQLVRIRYRDGEPVAVEDFVGRFLTPDGRGYTARVAGLAVARDGSLLFTDDMYGVVYRVSYTGQP